MKSPTPIEIMEARIRASLTQTNAAKVVYRTERTWCRWETGEKEMPLYTWELFLIKLAEGETEYKISSPSPTTIIAARERAELTQTAAAKVIHRSLRMWQRCESAEAAMPLDGWELFLRKTGYNSFQIRQK